MTGVQQQPQCLTDMQLMEPCLPPLKIKAKAQIYTGFCLVSSQTYEHPKITKNLLYSQKFTA